MLKVAACLPTTPPSQGILLPRSWALSYLGRPAASAFFTLLLQRGQPLGSRSRPLQLLIAVAEVLYRLLSTRSQLQAFLLGGRQKVHLPEEEVRHSVHASISAAGCRSDAAGAPLQVADAAQRLLLLLLVISANTKDPRVTRAVLAVVRSLAGDSAAGRDALIRGPRQERSGVVHVEALQLPPKPLVLSAKCFG